ncbi:MAG: hypothetical protein ThorAB25_16840 [Candidatus Thorarchaeota archaeon AB_25]|nr:MAG: hypothetical protein ThorAB25_16840 [Candidatus Thorarchaeota archaeon AB_25]
MRKKAFAVLVACSVIVATTLVTWSILNEGVDPDNAPNNASWLEDFEAFYDFIEGNYPYLWVKNRTHGYNWLDLKAGYQQRITGATNKSEILDVFLDAVCALQNRHTYIINPQYYSWYQSDLEGMPSPIGDVFSDEVLGAHLNWSSAYSESRLRRDYISFNALIVYEKGEYVITNSGPWDDHGENLRVVAVNGEPIDDAVLGCFEKDYVDWDYHRNKYYLWRISPRDFGSYAAFTVCNSVGQEVQMVFEISSDYSGAPYDYPGNIYLTQTWEAESTAYLYMSTFLWSTIDSHRETIVNFLQLVEDYDHLIIDIRGNQGGNYASWIHPIVRPLIKDTEIFQAFLAYRTNEYSDAYRTAVGITDLASKSLFGYLPPEAMGNEFLVYNYKHTFTPTYEVNFNGEISLLIDNVVYSASEGFTCFCKQTGFATIYGTTSGGDGIMEFPTYFCLPNSKMVITLSSALGLDQTGHSSEEFRTQPDVYYESSFGNHSELIDYVRSQLP